jgi:hypothetical protein
MVMTSYYDQNIVIECGPNSPLCKSNELIVMVDYDVANYIPVVFYILLGCVIAKHVLTTAYHGLKKWTDSPPYDASTMDTTLSASMRIQKRFSIYEPYQYNENSSLFDGIVHHMSSSFQTKHTCTYPNGLRLIEQEDDSAIHLGNGYHVMMNTLERDTENGSVVQEMELFSYDKTYSDLEKFAHNLERLFIQRRTQKMNNDTYVFNHVALPHSHTTFNFPSNTRYLFSKTPLTTTCSFINIYNEHIKRIVNRIDKFMKGTEWYRSKGIPYTLGIMFSGPSGCGKTSLVKAIARYTSRHVFNIRLTECTTVTQLRELLTNEQFYCLDDYGVVQTYTVPIDKRLFVFEDIDAIQPTLRTTPPQDTVSTTRGRSSSVTIPKNRTYQTELDTYMVDPYGFSHVVSPDEFASIQKQQLSMSFPSSLPSSTALSALSANDINDRLTLPALLHIIDGLVETSGRIIVMTTSNLDSLDKALVRPGRVDMLIKLEKCSIRDVYEIVCESTAMVIDYKRFAMIPDRYWTPAEVSQCVLSNNNDIDLILEHLSVKQKHEDSHHHSTTNQRNWVYHA